MSRFLPPDPETALGFGLNDPEPVADLARAIEDYTGRTGMRPSFLLSDPDTPAGTVSFRYDARHGVLIYVSPEYYARLDPKRTGYVLGLRCYEPNARPPPKRRKR